MPGMHVLPKEKWEAIPALWNAQNCAGKEVNVNVTGLTFRHAWNWKAQRDPMIFMGTEYEDYYWGGVRKFHKFLWRGQGVIITGYDVRYLEKGEQ